MPKAINIAIDGYSSTGKSTLAKDLSKALGYRYIDSGAMYRAATLYALQHGFIDAHGTISDRLVKDLEEGKLEMHFEYVPERNCSEIFLNGKNVENKIRDMKVSGYVSAVAAISPIRKALVKQQKKIAGHRKVVMDGRDIGTVVMPDAELKIFVTAQKGIRVQRRYEELLQRKKKVSRHEVEANLEQRDLIDSTRADSPLKQAEDALILDNSNLEREEQLSLALGWAKKIIAGK